MPYILQADRKVIDSLIEPLLTQVHNFSSGMLNYTLTRIVLAFLRGAGTPLLTYGYSEMNNVVGILECVKLELYRRLLSLYEDVKKEERGDVY